MRILWWKDVIDKVFAKKLVEHPVAQALSSVAFEQKIISKHWLKRPVDASRDEGVIPETTAELERYAEDTQSTILYMTLQAGGIRSTVADHAASHIGKAAVAAQGIASPCK
jgi:NADH dehydrogenase [ubiquinone] 1 alpha subcomplex assembly factor 6